MIGIDGQYLFKFKLGDLEDFIDEEELASFTLIEEAGGVLPTFELEFSGNVEEALQLMNETNKLEVSFGPDLDNLVSTPLSIKTNRNNRVGASKRAFYLNGIYNANAYLGDPKIFLSAKKSAVEVMADKAKANGFNFHKDNLKKSNDSMVWIQPSTTDRKFITEELWMHADLSGGIPAIGITASGDFIVKDLKAEGKKEPVWKFTYNATKENELVYDGDYATLDNTGFINSWRGYGIEQTVYDLEDGTQSKILNKPSPVTSMTSKLAKSVDVSKNFGRPAMLSDDMHANYWSVQNFNLTNLASMSATKIVLSFQGFYKPIKLLDQVFFSDDDVREAGSTASNFNAGRYFVTKVSRTLANKQLSTLVELCRESFNDIKTK